MIRPHEPLGLELLFAHLLLTPLSSLEKRRCDQRHIPAAGAPAGDAAADPLAVAMRVFQTVEIPGTRG
jgi:hypothetical protein